MKKYVITTDNNADLPESYYREHGVGCMYLSYTIDGVHYTYENFMDGYIDDYLVYNRAFTAAEAKALYDSMK